MKTASPGRRPTIVDVAALAGVSNSTASRVFDSKWDGRIREDTRHAVLEAAARLGYHGTSALVRGLQNGQTNIIALVVGSTTGYFYLEVLMKFVRALRATGRQVLIFEADPVRGLRDIVTQVHQYQVDAIIITAAATTSAILESFCDTAVPVIAFNREAPGSNISAVYCDGRSAARMAADFMLDQGLRSFAVISGDANVSKELGRVEGFCARVHERGGEVLNVFPGDYTYESGYALAKQLLARTRPDALFCAEDTIAMGAIDAARECFGLSVPEELSVMGFDNTSVGRFHAYALTTVAHPIEQLIEAAIETMERLLVAPEAPIQRVFDMQLVVRGSVRCRP